MDQITNEEIQSLADAVTENQNKVCCPHCNKPFELRQFAEFKPTLLTMAYTVEAGHLMSLKSIGGSLSALHDLLVASARQLGGSVAPMLKGVRVSDSSYEFDILIAEAPPKKRNRK